MVQMHLAVLYFATGNLITMFVPVKVIHWTLPNFYSNTFFYIACFGFVIAFTSHFFPIKKAGIAKIYSSLFNLSFKKPIIDDTYDDIEGILKENYDMFHPVYKNKANKF